jgi:hypothetical protein
LVKHPSSAKTMISADVANPLAAKISSCL